MSGLGTDEAAQAAAKQWITGQRIDVSKAKAIGVGIGVIGVVWVATVLAMSSFRSQQPTAEKVEQFIADHPLENLPVDDRQAFVAELAERVNRLPHDQRRALRTNPRMRQVIQSMTETERMAYLDRTLPEGFRQFMDAVDEMEPEERDKLVQRAMEDIEREALRQRRGQSRPYFTEAERQRILEAGVTAYYRDASAETKIALQPLVEQLQQLSRSRQ